MFDKPKNGNKEHKDQEKKPLSERAQQASGLPARNSGANGNSAVTQTQAPPAHLAEYAAEAGAGTSQAAEDNLVPLIYVLTYQSPQCDRRDGKYVEGAEPGDLWLRNAPEGLEIAKTSDPEFSGLLVQPCYFWTDWGQWLPRDEGGGGGAGFAGRHPNKKVNGINTPDMPGAKQDHEDRNHWTTADGVHDLVETRNYAVFVYVGGRAIRYIIPFASTGHTVAKGWMTKINDKIINEGPNRGKPYPSYAHLYHLSTEPRSNKEGKWFGVVVKDAVWASAEQAAEGKKFNRLMTAGELRAESPEEQQSSQGTGGAAASAEAEKHI